MDTNKNPLLSNLYLWLAFKTVSDLSSSIISILLATYVYRISGSASQLGLVMALQLLGAVVGGALLPRLAMFSRRYLIVVAELGSGLAIGMLALSPAYADVWLIYPAPFFLGAFRGLYRVAIMSEIPVLVGQDGRHKLNAILSACDGLAVVAGSLIAAVITLYLPFKIAFSIDMLTFLMSASTFWALLCGKSEQAEIAESVYRNDHSFDHQGLAAYLPTLMVLVIGARFVEAFGSGTHNVGFPIKSRLFDAVNPAFLYGWIMAAWGAGRLLSALWAPRLLKGMEQQHKSLELLFIVMLITTFACFLGVFQSHTLFLILPCAILAGVFDATTETTYYSVLQAAPSALRAKTISVSYMAERGGLGLGMLLVGLCFARHGVEITALLFYGSSIVLAVVMLEKVRRQLTRSVAV